MMDFFVGLSRMQAGHDTIWVTVDKLTKMAHSLLIKNTSTLGKLEKLCIKETVRLHGVSMTIVSNRDPRFMSSIYKALQKAMGTRLSFCTTYHQQMDGKSERTIQTLEDMLRTCVLDFKDNWDQSPPLIEFAYYNSYHSSIRMAFFGSIVQQELQIAIILV